MRKWNKRLNSIMGGCCGWFIGHGICVVWDYLANPGKYAMQSAPWYTRIWMSGVVALVILVVCLVIKAILRYRIRKAGNDAVE